jgi:hypothetical protein
MYTTTTIIHYNRHLLVRQEFGKYKWRGKEFDTEEQAFKAIDDKIAHFKNKNMEQNKFEWDENLVAECYQYIKQDTAGTLTPFGVMENIRHFIASKTKPKEYEILSFSHNLFGVEVLKSIKRNDDGTFGAYFVEESVFLNSHTHKIDSVRRTSDNKVFSIGIDGVQSFYIECGKLWARCGNKGTLELSELQKAKQPILTTHDGKDIFEGDKICPVSNSFEVYEEIICYANWYRTTKESFIAYFSTKEAAETYVLMNKPMLSIKDVEQCYTSPKPSPLYNEMYKNLIELAKSKTKQ